MTANHSLLDSLSVTHILSRTGVGGRHFLKNPCTKKANHIRKTKLFLADKPLIKLNCVHFGIRIFSILLIFFFFFCCWNGYVISVLVKDFASESTGEFRTAGHLNKKPTSWKKQCNSQKLGSWLINLKPEYTVGLVICMKSRFENGLWKWFLTCSFCRYTAALSPLLL